MAQPVLGGTYYVQFQLLGGATANDHLNRAAHAPWPFVQDKDLTAPPGTPSLGQAWVVAAGATGPWLGHDGEYAFWYDSGWMFRPMQDGELFQALDEPTVAAVYFNDAGTYIKVASL